MTDLHQCETHRIGYWHPSGCPMCKADADQGDLARALLDARAELDRLRADAQAAVALVLEQAAQQCEFRDHSEGEEETEFDQGYDQACDECATIVRALADADGLAAVDALRAEARESAMQALASMGQAQEAYEAQLKAEAELAAAQQREAVLVERAEKAEAERDKWFEGAGAHHVASMQQAQRADIAEVKLARLREAMEDIAKQKRTNELATEYDVECADFEGGYDACIDRARAGLEDGMNDDLIKRLRRCFNGLEGLQTDQGDYGVLAEAAAALSEAQATIARQQVMLDRALESNGDMQAEVARLREGLSRINNKAIMNAGEFARYVRNECATLEAKNG